MEKLTVNAPAKINLYLEITAKRPDGYHDIESVMQSVTLFDTLHFEKKEGKGRNITLTSDSASMPCDGTNLICKAAVALFEAADISEYELSVHVEKRIPMAAGLGGGSADAAAALMAVNELYSIGFDEDRLCAMGARLGADVPFCVKRGIAVTRGIGDVMSDCPRLPDCYIAVACKGEGVSTPWAYKKLDGMYDFASRNTDFEAFTAALKAGNINAVCEKMTNIFESAVLPERPVARMIRDTFDSFGALRSMMSGSGPSVIGIFESLDLAEAAKAKLGDADIEVRITKPYYPA